MLKSRQLGVSTNEILKQFDMTIWTENYTAVILAHEQAAIEKLFRIVSRAYKFMPEEIRPEIDRGGGSRYEYFFPKMNSRIYCTLESRGDTINWLHISERAFMKDSLKVKATKEAVPLDGIITEETTPNGIGSEFFDDWNDPDSIYTNLFFPWYLHDEYKIKTERLIYSLEENELIEKAKALFNIRITKEQIAFRRFKKAELKGLFIQEYPEDENSCFLASGNPAMDLEIVSNKIATVKPILSKKDNITIFETFDKRKSYVMGCDTAEGVGGDNSAAILVDASTREQVAIIHGQMKPSVFAKACDKLCRWYSHGDNYPLLGVERNNHGHAVLLELDEHLDYPNLYKSKDDRIGWLTDRVTRPIMIDTLIDGIEDNNFIINCKVTLGECLTLIVKNGKIEAASGKHDDCVIAAAIALQLCIEGKLSSVYDNIESMVLV